MAPYSTQINVWNIIRWYKSQWKADEYLHKYGKQSMLDNSRFRNIGNDDAFMGRQKSNWQNAFENKCHEMQISSGLWRAYIRNKWIRLHTSKWWLGRKKCWIWLKPGNIRTKAKWNKEKFARTDKSSVSWSISNSFFNKSWKWALAWFYAFLNVELTTEYKFINTNRHENLRRVKRKRINN